jgi:hypothetical protein
MVVTGKWDAFGACCCHCLNRVIDVRTAEFEYFLNVADSIGAS